MKKKYASISKNTVSNKAALIGTAILVCTASANVSAGAWVPEKGSGYAKLGIAEYSADDTHNGNPDFIGFDGQNLSFYGEYGLGNNLSIFTTILYQDIEQRIQPAVMGDPITKTDNNGFSDLELAVKYQWDTEPFVLSTSFLVKLPWLYDEDDELPLGNGQVDYELKFLLGKSLNQFGYYGVELGYRYREDAPTDQYRYLLEYGFSATENLYFRTKLDAIKSVNNIDANAAQTDTNLSLASEFDLGKLELTAGWNFGEANTNEPRYGIELTYTNEIYGENTLQGDGFQLALTKVF